MHMRKTLFSWLYQGLLNVGFSALDIPPEIFNRYSRGEQQAGMSRGKNTGGTSREEKLKSIICNSELARAKGVV